MKMKKLREIHIHSTQTYYIIQGRKINTLKELIKSAHEARIKVKAWIPQFHDFVATRTNKDWQMISQRGTGKTDAFTGGRKDHHEYFINPCHEGAKKYELSIIEEILQNYDVYMNALDWLRFDSSLMRQFV